MKTKEELEQIKNEYVELNQKLAELTEDELKQVVGGNDQFVCPLSQSVKHVNKCQNYPCSENLQPLQGYGYYCPIAMESVGDSKY